MKGIKIVTPGSSIHTNNPLNIVLDPTDKGSLKIDQIVPFTTDNVDETYLNGSGVSVGRKIIPHSLGYSPAFLGFIYGQGNALVAGGITFLLPASGPLGGPDLEVISEPTKITVDGISPIAKGTPPDTITVVIFAESLDV